MNIAKPKECQYTSFLGDDIDTLLFEVASWMRSYTISKSHTNQFYFLQMIQSYDSEMGYEICVYHGKEK